MGKQESVEEKVISEALNKAGKVNPYAKVANIANKVTGGKVAKVGARAIPKVPNMPTGFLDNNKINELEKDGLENQDGLEEKENNKFSLKSYFKKRFNKNNKDSKAKEDDSAVGDTLNIVKKIKIIISAISAILPIILPSIVAIIVVIVILSPVLHFVDWVKGVWYDFTDEFGLVSYTESKEKGRNEMYERVIEVKNTSISKFSSDIDENLLAAGLIYGSYDLVEEFDIYSDLEADKNAANIDYKKLKKDAYFTGRNMLYLTSILTNEGIWVDELNEKGEVVDQHLECVRGEKIDNIKDLVSYQRISDDFIDQKETADEEKYFEDLICVDHNYRLDTGKFENYLRYVYIPYKMFDVDSGDPIDELKKDKRWENFDRELDSEYDPKKLGNEYDAYSGLSVEQKKIVDDQIELINAAISNVEDYFDVFVNAIPGEVAMPIDLGIGEDWESRITSYYGNREIDGVPGFHSGIDIGWKGVKTGPIYAVADGVVVEVSFNYSSTVGYGAYVKLGHDTDFDGEYNYYTLYAHLSNVTVQVDDVVKNSQQIGNMGDSGHSFGNHLHFELRDSSNSTMDPLTELQSIWNRVNQNASSSSSLLVTSGVSSLTASRIEELNNGLSVAVNTVGIKTREASLAAASFLSKELTGLPYFWGGFTRTGINSKWYTSQMVTAETEGLISTQTKGGYYPYGMDCSGFVSWVLNNAGYNLGYKDASALSNLGTKVELYDSRVKKGDLAWKDGHIGIIVQLDNDNMWVAHESGVEYGLIVKQYSRNVTSIFTNAILMDDFYSKEA